MQKKILLHNALYNRKIKCTASKKTQQRILLSDTQLLNQGAIAINIFLLQILQQAAALADQLEQTAPGMMILGMGLEMFRKITDAF